MLREIELVDYKRDDQIPKTSYFKAIHQQFRLTDVRYGIVDVDGSNLVISNKRNCYLIFRSAPREILQQIQELLTQVSISMSMEIPLERRETITDEEQFRKDDSDKQLKKFIRSKKN